MLKYLFDVFLQTIKERDRLFLSLNERGVGKTYVINELGFTLQALEYEPYILTINPIREYFAVDFIINVDYLRGIHIEKAVILVDEYDFNKMDEILDYCSCYKIPIVGFVR